MRFTQFVLAVFLSAMHIAAASAAEVRAVTEDGRKVLLTPDGRWRYDAKSSVPMQTLADQSPYQTQVKKFLLAYDSSKWIPVQREGQSETNKKLFKHKTLPIYGMVIADEIPAATEAIKNVILYNAKTAGTDLKVILDETKNISGKTAGSIRFVGALGGVDFMFTGYYYGDADGNVQVMCYTGQQIFYKYESDCQQFIGGLIIK